MPHLLFLLFFFLQKVCHKSFFLFAGQTAHWLAAGVLQQSFDEHIFVADFIAFDKH